METLINKTDFTPRNFVKFSQNIREDQIEPYIFAAQENDLRPRIGDDLTVALFASSESESPEHFAFLNNFVKRFLVLASYYRFMASHGINVTQFGVSKTADPQNTFDQVAPQDRAIILRQTAADLNTALARMMAQNFVFDGVDYGKSDKAKKLFSSIRAPKRKASPGTVGLIPGKKAEPGTGNILDSVLNELL